MRNYCSLLCPSLLSLSVLLLCLVLVSKSVDSSCSAIFPHLRSPSFIELVLLDGARLLTRSLVNFAINAAQCNAAQHNSSHGLDRSLAGSARWACACSLRQGLRLEASSVRSCWLSSCLFASELNFVRQSFQAPSSIPSRQ
mmetsp:Transcript_5633/g.11544  ORF Transcript_5633/g.11544 Transcript_5633/m.11544 type:complete len:141 (-) Transcript_5633:804-1226(-)